MGDGTTVSTTPMEWRSRVRASAQAHPVVFHERDIGRRILQLRDEVIRLLHQEVPRLRLRRDIRPRQSAEGRR